MKFLESIPCMRVDVIRSVTGHVVGVIGVYSKKSILILMVQTHVYRSLWVVYNNDQLRSPWVIQYLLLSYEGLESECDTNSAE